MSVSAKLRMKEDEALANARNRHRIVSEACDAVDFTGIEPTSIYSSGYCATATVAYENVDWKELLACLPALPCVNITGGTQSQKPMLYLKPDEMYYSDIQVIHPVQMKTSGNTNTVRWWTIQNEMPLTIQVSVPDAACFEAPEHTYPVHHRYSTGSCLFFVPKKIMPPTCRPATLADMPEVEHKLHDFFSVRGTPRFQLLSAKDAVALICGVGIANTTPTAAGGKLTFPVLLPENIWHSITVPYQEKELPCLVNLELPLGCVDPAYDRPVMALVAKYLDTRHLSC